MAQQHHTQLLAFTASNDWEKGFAAGARMGEAGIVSMARKIVDEVEIQRAPQTASELEIVRLLRSIECLLSNRLMDFPTAGKLAS